DLLGAQVLLHGHRIVGAALDGGVVADDDALAPFDAPDPGDDAGAMDRVVVEAVGGKRREFEERGAGVEQAHHPVARQKLAALELALARPFGAAQSRLGAAMLKLGNERTHLRGIGAEMLGADVNDGGNPRHAALPDDQAALWRGRNRKETGAQTRRPAKHYRDLRKARGRHNEEAAVKAARRELHPRIPLFAAW